VPVKVRACQPVRLQKPRGHVSKQNGIIIRETDLIDWGSAHFPLPVGIWNKAYCETEGQATEPLTFAALRSNADNQLDHAIRILSHLSSTASRMMWYDIVFSEGYIP
jgi:hypothetical protein